MKKISQSNRRKIYIALYILALTALAVFLHSDHFLNADEGVILNGAWNIYNGRKLYLDFFSFLPPLSFYVIAWLWNLVGVSFWSAKILSIGFLLVGALGLYKIAEKSRPNILNLLVPSFFILSTSGIWVINHNFYQLIFGIWAAYFFIVYISSRRYQTLIIAGLLAGLSIVTLQQKGLAFAGAGVLFLLLTKKFGTYLYRLKAACVYGLSTLVPLMLLLIFWSPLILWQNLICFPLFNYIESNRISYYLLVMAVITLASVVLALNKLKTAQAYLIIICAAMLLSCYPLPDSYHLGIALALIIPLLPVLINFSAKGWPRFWRIISFSGLAIIWLWPASMFIVLSHYNVYSVSAYGFLNYIRQECPGKYLQVGPFLPNIYFETGKLSATSFDILITGQQTAAQFSLAGEQLAKVAPACAVTIYPNSLKRFQYNRDNPVDNYIKDHYQAVYTEDSVTVWKNQLLMDR